jgi:hypothetical protein
MQIHFFQEPLREQERDSHCEALMPMGSQVRKEGL